MIYYFPMVAFASLALAVAAATLAIVNGLFICAGVNGPVTPPTPPAPSRRAGPSPSPQGPPLGRKQLSPPIVFHEPA